MQRPRVSPLGSLLLVLGSLWSGCASEKAAQRQHQAEEHVYIGPRTSFLDRAGRLLAEKGQSPQQIAPDTLQTRWVLVSGASTDPRHGAEPLVYQSYRVRVTSLDDLHHYVRIERGTVTTFQAPTRSEMQPPMMSNTANMPGSEQGLPSIDPPVSSGLPVFVSDGDLEWELLRRTDPAAAAEIDQQKPAAPGH